MIKTTTLKVTQQLWLHILVALLVSLPIISVIGQSAKADFVPTPPDSGQPDDNRRAGSTR